MLNQPNPVTTDELTYCAVHPDRETSLRCNKCGRYMCPQCAVPTPVGYRCKECIRQLEDKFFNVGQNDYLIVLAACALLAGVGGFIASAVGSLFLIIIAGLPIGGAIGEAALRVIQRRRGRYSGEIAAAGVVVGGLVGGMIHTYTQWQSYIGQAAGRLPQGAASIAITPEILLQETITNIALLVFIGIVAFAVYGRFKMRI
jgi:MFS family permease